MGTDNEEMESFLFIRKELTKAGTWEDGRRDQRSALRHGRYA
jgi:hypothetical protein